MSLPDIVLVAVIVALLAREAVLRLRVGRTRSRIDGRLRRRIDAADREQKDLVRELERAHRTEADLRESEAFSRALFAAAHAGLLVVNLDTRQIMDANEAAARLVGRDLADIVGSVACPTLESLLGPADGAEAAQDGDADRDTIEFADARGERRTCIRSLTPLDRGDGRLAVVSLLDITEQKAVEAELRESWARLNEANVQLKRHRNQMIRSEKLASIGQLAAGVAHEINNPVGYVSSNLGTIREYVAVMRALLALHEELAARPGDADLTARIAALRADEDLDFILEDLDGLLDESREGAERIADIVKNLKSFAREDAMEMAPQDLNDVVESMVRMAWNELKYKCTVERDYGELPPVRCHAGRISQVVVNMLVNAAQAIPDGGGTVRVATAVEGDEAVVTIADDGCGMDAATLERIFDPFYTTKDVGQGTGLGLAISHGIVEEHGGRIDVASEPGRGTTFRIRLPLEPRPAAVDMIG